MPYTRPTLTQIRAQALADLDAGLPAEMGRLRFSVVGVLAQALAGAVNGNYGYLDYIAKQGVPFTSSDEYLAAWGALKGVEQESAGYAIGAWTMAAEAGADTVTAGTTITRADGVVYLSTADAVPADGAVIVPVKAAIADATGNCAVGAVGTMGTAFAGVATIGTVSTACTGGTPVQSQDSYRADVLEAYAEISGGGTVADYERWARKVAGVTRAWAVRAEMGPGTVTLRIMLDVANAGGGGFPIGSDGVATDETSGPAEATGDQLRVADYVFGQQPADATVYVVAPIANAVAFTISGLDAAPTSVKTSIAAALAALFYDQGAPAGLIELSEIEGAIGGVAGSAGFIITAMSCDHGSIAPAVGNIQCNTGAIPVLGVITWT